MRFDCLNWHPERRFLKALELFTQHDTPNLDRFSDQCVRFTRCLSPAGYTALSVPSTLTGTYARTHGVVDFTSTCLRDHVQTLCSLLRSGGYRIVLHSAKSSIVTDLGLFADADLTLTSDAELIRLLRTEPGVPTLVYSHFNDLHAPYVWLESGTPAEKAAGYDVYLRLTYNARRADPGEDPPFHFVLPSGRRVSLYELRDQPPGGNAQALLGHLRRQLNAYYCGLEKFDRLRFGPLLRELSRLEQWRRGIVVFYADHGEAQRPFAQWSIDHGATGEENLVRTPLMIRAPGLRPRQVNDLVGLIDLTPTVLELVGLGTALDEVGYEVAGRSLVPVLRGGRHGAQWYWIEGWHFAETSLSNPPCVKYRALRYADGRKYILFGDLIRREEYEALDEPEFATYAATHTYGTRPTPWFRQRIATLRQTHDRAAVIAMLRREVRQFRICDNVDQDLLEEHSQAVEPDSQRWPEYQVQLEKMLRLTARPNLRPSDSADEVTRARVDQRLRALGYIA